MKIDDRSRDDFTSNIGTVWRGFSDRVMGGISLEHVTLDCVEGRRCLRLSGDVRLENNGGFIQMTLDLSQNGVLDAREFTGLRLHVWGNGETFGAHLRTLDTTLPWQSYRLGFEAVTQWHEIDLPFSAFKPYRLDLPLNTRHLRRLGLVAIGRAFYADLGVSEVGFYR